MILVICRIRDYTNHQRVLDYQITNWAFGGNAAPPGEVHRIFRISRRKILPPLHLVQEILHGVHMEWKIRDTAFGVMNYPDANPYNTTEGQRVTQRDFKGTIAITNKVKPQWDGE